MRAAWTAALLAAGLAALGCRDARVSAHVPPPADFERLLRRDLGGYFSVRLEGPAPVHHELLQAGPTLRTSPYPLYFAWVRVAREGADPLEGALVLQAVERTHFRVADFATADELRHDPGLAERLFPRAVAEAVRERLEAGRPGRE